MSVNLELPTSEGLKRLAPAKTRDKILAPMRQIQRGIQVQRQEIVPYRDRRRFVPAGQSTQMIVGATPENDYQMISVAEALYRNYELKRVFYSAFVRVNDDSLLPALPAPSSGTQIVSGGLADAVLWFSGRRASFYKTA